MSKTTKTLVLNRFLPVDGPKRAVLAVFYLGQKWEIHFLHATQREQRAGRAECTLVTLFP